MGKKIRLKDETKELFYGVGLLLLGVLAFVWVANKQHDVESNADKNGFVKVSDKAQQLFTVVSTNGTQTRTQAWSLKDLVLEQAGEG